MDKWTRFSLFAFMISLAVYVIFFFTGKEVNGTVMILLVIVLPICGMGAAIVGKKGKSANVGLLGNMFVLFLTAIIPALSVFFWNQP